MEPGPPGPGAADANPGPRGRETPSPSRPKGTACPRTVRHLAREKVAVGAGRVLNGAMQAPWFFVQLAVTAALAGLCWTVQLTVYAYFGRLLKACGVDGFRAYHAAYTRSMGFVAAPLMLAEIALAARWCWIAPGSTEAWIAAAGVAWVWGLTFGCIVPLHNRLQAVPDVRSVGRLVALNWLRTGAWSARTGWLIWVLV